jgi:hypothetical protein
MDDYAIYFVKAQLKINRRGMPKSGGIWPEAAIIDLMQINLGNLMPFFVYMNSILDR